MARLHKARGYGDKSSNQESDGLFTNISEGRAKALLSTHLPDSFSADQLTQLVDYNPMNWRAARENLTICTVRWVIRKKVENGRSNLHTKSGKKFLLLDQISKAD